MEFLKNKIDDLKIWSLDKGDMVENFWLNFYKWSQLKSLNANWSPEDVPEWFLIMDSLANKWNVNPCTSGGMQTFVRKFRELLKKPRNKIAQEVLDSIILNTKDKVA